MHEKIGLKSPLFGNMATSREMSETLETNSDREQEAFNAAKEKYSFLAEKFFTLSAVSIKSRDTSMEFRCVSCGKKQTVTTSSTSNLRRHVRGAHAGLCQEYEQLWDCQKRKASQTEDNAKRPKIQTNLRNFFALSGSASATQLVTQKVIDQKVLAFVVQTNQPFSVVEHKSFQDLVLLGKSKKEGY